VIVTLNDLISFQEQGSKG